MPDSVEEPAPEDIGVEEDILKTDAVELRLPHELGFVKLPVEDRKPNDRKARKDHVIKLIQVDVVNHCSREE